MGYRVVIDTDECVSAGKCVATAPSYFRFDDNELATVDPTGQVPDDATLLRIARSCPSQAIALYEEGSDTPVPL
jgi:ferredoxin